MAHKIFDQVGGIITVGLYGPTPERMINMALTRGIYIWNIKSNSDGITLKIRSSAFDALATLAEENGYRLEVISKQGLPFYKNLIKRRMGFLVGGVFFVAALYLMASFVWFVDVQGNQRLTSEKILSAAARYGVYRGVPKWHFSKNQVENTLLQEFSDLTYVKLNMRGVKVHIEVVEKIVPQDEITGPCHVVASKNGVIEEILVLDGQARVREGDVVGKGDILISGIVVPVQNPFMPPSSQPPQPEQVRARGVVNARVWYEGYGECPLKSETLVLSGQESTIIAITTPWNDLIVWGRRAPMFVLQDSSEVRKIIQTPLGNLGFVYRKNLEQVIEVARYSEREATQTARDRAIQALQSRIGSQLNTQEAHVDILSSPSDAILRVRVAVEVIEDVALPQPINDAENSTSR